MHTTECLFDLLEHVTSKLITKKRILKKKKNTASCIVGDFHETQNKTD